MRPAAILALLAALSHPTISLADTTRGCKAVWEIRTGAISRQFGQFESRGQCKDSSTAHECWRAARSYAWACFREAWAKRQDPNIRSGHATPSNCLSRGAVRVRGYHIDDIKETIEEYACAMPRPRPFRVVIVGRTFDGQRCGGEVILSDNYEIRDEMCAPV